MLVNTVTLANGQQVFLIDEFFTAQPLASLHTICDAFTRDNPAWSQPDGFNRSRWVYDCNQAEFDTVRDHVYSTELTDHVSRLIGYSVNLTNTAMWVDFTGVGQLRPHCETASGFLAQIFVTRSTDNYNGTTFYTDSRQVLFQLPYRNNFGWLFEGDRVLHGRQADVSPGLARFIIMLWYARSQ